MSRAEPSAMDPGQTYPPDGWRIAGAFRSAGPALLFGLRLWASVCLALYIAFWLELDNAYWAGTTAAIVCQPNLGASLRKGWFRMVGTVVGAVAIVVLTACFPQERTGFLLGLAFWGALCGLMATLLRNFASYAAALAGYTAAIIASDQLGATGGVNGEAFTLAITRASEICIGIICAGIVLAVTDFGGARRRLAAQLAAISAEIAGRLAGTFLLTGPEQSKTRPVRRDLVRRVTALDPLIDQALGEDSDLRPHSPSLRPRWVACSRPCPAGGRRPFTSSCCGVTRAGGKRTLYLEISPKSCVQCRRRVRRQAGRSIRRAYAGRALRQCGLWQPCRIARRRSNCSPIRQPRR
jgi:hypothetical protein